MQVGIVGVVVEQGFQVPVADAVVTLFRVGGGPAGGEMEPVATAVSDEAGRFLFATPEPGRYRLAADHNGLSSSLSPVFQVGAMADSGGEGAGEPHVLVLPSRLLMLAATCDVEAQPGAVVVGQVRDLLSGVAVPGARVEARWMDPALGEREQITQTDASGRYRICGVRAPSDLRLRAEMLGRSGGWGAVEVPRAAVLVHDLAFSLATATAVTDDEIDWTSASSSAVGGGGAASGVERGVSASLGDLTGRLVDRNSGEPVGGAVVRIRGTGFQGLTDGTGAFAFLDLRPGAYTLEIHHLGYALEARSVELPEGRILRMTLQVSPQAVELDEIEVVARSAAEQVIRTTPFRRYVVSGEVLADEELRGARLDDVLRRHMVGLRVQERVSEWGSHLCIETARRIQRLQEADTVPDPLRSSRDVAGRPCAMVQVIVDGTRLSDGDGSGGHVADLLRSLPVTDIESMEYLPPTHGTLLFGVSGNVSNGVLVIHTRGKGPYRSAARDRLPGEGRDREPDP
jgi:hypothetical protein